jgi:hypothetical protein
MKNSRNIITDKRVRIIAGLGEVGWDKAAAAAGPPESSLR